MPISRPQPEDSWKPENAQIKHLLHLASRLPAGSAKKQGPEAAAATAAAYRQPARDSVEQNAAKNATP
jgi:hypothetical protein